MFYKYFFRFLVDYIAKNDIFVQNSPKLGKIFCLKPMTTNHTNNKIKTVLKCLWVEISALIGNISPLS